MKKILFISLFGLLLPVSLFAQEAQDYSNWDTNKSSQIRQIERTSLPKSTGISSRRNPFYKIPLRRKIYERKLSKEQKKLITPSEENLSKYEQFLKTPKTGIVKMLADPKCHEYVVDADNLKCVNALPIYGHGSEYSFSQKTHTKFNTAEIYLTDNIFKVGFLSNFSSLIVDLSDKDINSISKNTEEAKVLGSILPTKIFSKFEKQKQEIDEGFYLNGKSYKLEAGAELNHTYIIRSVRYYRVYYFMLEPYYDDIMLVFRVVEKDADGGVTLIWKELARKEKVYLKS